MISNAKVADPKTTQNTFDENSKNKLFSTSKTTKSNLVFDYHPPFIVHLSER